MEGSKEAIEWDLAEWLQRIEVSCNDDQRKQWLFPPPDQTPGKPPVSGCNKTAKDGWTTYLTVQDTPLDALVTALSDVLTAQPIWIDKRPLVRTVTSSTAPFTERFATRLDVTEDKWVFSYLSPVVGYAFAGPTRDDKREGMTLHYFGVQLHIKPNPAHLPTGGWGMFALELGATPGAGAFGPDGRYRGLSNIAPIFIGGAVHLIPYTSFSLGCMVAERRTTALTGTPGKTVVVDAIVAGYPADTVTVTLQ
jgi:hypothetical protein